MTTEHFRLFVILGVLKAQFLGNGHTGARRAIQTSSRSEGQ